MKLVLLVFSICLTWFLAAAEEDSERDARDTVTHTCKLGTSIKHIRIEKDTIGVMKSDIWSSQKIKCRTVFKMRGSCESLRIVCAQFDVPYGPNRKFTIDRKRYTNKD